MDPNRRHAIDAHVPAADLVLTHEIEAALDVAPSPEFTARVRMQIAAQEDAAAGRFAWKYRWLFGVAPVATVVVAVVLMMRSDERVVRDVMPAGHSIVKTSPHPLLLHPDANVRQPAIHNGAQTVARVRRLSHEPEVIISANEAAALKRLIAGEYAWVELKPDEDGAVTIRTDIPEQPVEIEALRDIREIEISTIAIDPLADIAQ